MTFGKNLLGLINSGCLSAPPVKFARRELVYGCLDRDGSMYLVERGQVKAVASSRDGKDCLLGIYAIGDVFGESCLVERERTETVTAMTRTVLRRVSSTRMRSALCDARLREEFIKHLAHRILEQQQLITDLVTADSEYRLAAVVLYLARKLGHRDGQLLRIEERITQEELSGMVGTTRSRVGYFLKGFCDAGLIARDKGSFLTVNESRLEQYLRADALLRPRPELSDSDIEATRPRQLGHLLPMRRTGRAAEPVVRVASRNGRN